MSDDAKFHAVIAEALQGQPSLFPDKGDIVDHFNSSFDYVLSLLSDALTLYQASSFNTSVFISITAIEEVAKIEIGAYRQKSAAAMDRKNEPLFNHTKKHTIAVAPVIALGGRLVKLLGETRIGELIKMAQDGDFSRLREKALYLSKEANQLIRPDQVISKELAREIFLIALETLDDRLIGYTNYSMSCPVPDKLFNAITSQ